MTAAAARAAEQIMRSWRAIASTSEPPDTRIDGAAQTESYECGALSESVSTNSGVPMPRLIYGTDGSEQQFEDRMRRAVHAGFRGIDTSGQPAHRYEPGAGKALAAVVGSGLERDSLFIQTSVNLDYTPAEVNPRFTIAEQVELSIEKSLAYLRLEFLDSWLLQSPYPEHEQTMEAWHAMESVACAGMVRQLGLLNVQSVEQLSRIYKDATLKPAVVQQSNTPEREIREWCTENGIVLQTGEFRNISGSPSYGRCARMQRLAKEYSVTPSMLFLRFVMSLGVVPVTSACSENLMKEELSTCQIPLTEQDAATVDALLEQSDAAGKRTRAQRLQEQSRRVLDETRVCRAG
eukprot:gnl/TRDRNA2_/TRDRNA2_162513_c1_seq1.p1 gnl/TRDRNA2_/TRDRNA2_162513_c1~~gnl/TRDRNA2_/TRDRNA2_162513_c1_seq1.p1  ORF type:complete len:400 (-),score=58.20 gnl/TRDRNA2_/TRDRNA2_162513_c1_seq1:58-1104(-)